MNLLQYKIKDDHDINSYASDLAKEKVILNDYFYYTENSFIDSINIYSEKQVARILSLTDKEYVELIQKYLTSSNEESDSSNKENIDIQNKIDEINAKIQKSKDYEEAQKRLKDIEVELQKTEKDLTSYEGLEEKISIAQQQVASFGQFSKFNLQKIHDDLVNLNNQIDKLEEDLIDKKIVEIKESKTKYEYDSGKIGLAIGILIGLGVFGAIFLVLNAPFWISASIWGFGVITALIIILFSKVPKSEDNFESENFSPHEINNLLETLRAQRNSILNLVGISNTNEFFLMKAKYSSAKKNLDFMINLKNDLSQRLDLSTVKESRDKLKNELEEVKIKTVDSSVLLQSDEYLNLYRELDSLKLKIGSNSIDTISKTDIPNKLQEIRKELSDKLPTYSSVLKNTFTKSYENILSTINSISNEIGKSPLSISNTLNEWNNLNKFEKFLILLAIAKEVYIENFAFILEEVSSWNQQEFDNLKLLIDKKIQINFDLIIIDYDNVF